MAVNPFAAVQFGGSSISAASSVLNQLTGLNNAQWSVSESAYGHPPSDLVLFHVFKTKENYGASVDQVTDTISRRVVEYEFPFVDGQTTDDLGRGGGKFEFNILIFGPNYYSAYVALQKEFNNPVPGQLIHPVLGPITAKFKNAQVMHRSDSRQAVLLRALFVEHTFNVTFKQPQISTPSILAQAAGFIGTLAGVYTDIQSNLIAASIIVKSVQNAMAAFQAAYTSALVGMNTTFNGGNSANIPGLLPNNSAQGTAFLSAISPNDPFANLTSSQIQAQQSPQLSALQAEDVVINLRNQATALIELMESSTSDGVPGWGSIALYDQILTIKDSMAAMQQVLQTGIQSSNASTFVYTVPRLMSVRELCFLNGLTPDDSYSIELLNPTLLSLNYIPAGTVVQVPTS